MTKHLDWLTNDPAAAKILRAADRERRRIATTPMTLEQKLVAIARAKEKRDKALEEAGYAVAL